LKDLVCFPVAFPLEVSNLIAKPFGLPIGMVGISFVAVRWNVRITNDERKITHNARHDAHNELLQV
jgi:hypothetical protein